MNPIIKTVIFLLAWVILTFLCIWFVGDRPPGAEMPLAILLISFRLCPFGVFIVFLISSFLQKDWIKKNSILFLVVSLLLAAWVLNSLFNYYMFYFKNY